MSEIKEGDVSKAQRRKFGQQTPGELEEARAIATEMIEIYGDFQQQALWDRFRENGIWNDHAAVQSALRVIMDRNDQLRKQMIT